MMLYLLLVPLGLLALLLGFCWAYRNSWVDDD